MAKQDDFIKTALRVPPDLHRQIHEAAAAANRTFNAEIVARLQLSFEHGALWDKRKEVAETAERTLLLAEETEKIMSSNAERISAVESRLEQVRLENESYVKLFSRLIELAPGLPNDLLDTFERALRLHNKQKRVSSTASRERNTKKKSDTA